MAVSPVTSGLPITAPNAARPRPETGAQQVEGKEFARDLVDALDRVDASVKAADAEVAKVVRGDSVELHGVVMAMEKADVSLRLMTQVGRRAIDAYREIMRLNV